MKTLLGALVIVLWSTLLCAQANRVFYVGGSGADRFNDVHRLSDGSLLIAGQSTDLSWIGAAVPQRTLATTGIDSAATGQIGFILHVSADLSSLLQVVRFPTGSVRDVFKIRSSEVPGQNTSAIFISGSRDGASGEDGYFLARLDQNFLNAPPSALTWTVNVRAAASVKERQPWDVGGDGKVVYALGREFDPNWAAIQRLSASGAPEVVEHWQAHWHAGGEWDGTPASTYSGTLPLSYSAIVMKVNRRGSLRSSTAADFALTQTDANGNPGRQGRFPDDYYHNTHCELAAGSSCPNNGPGYTGYRAASAQTQRVGGIVVDRRTNAIYFGYSTKSVLPDGNPDFEPALVAMRADGQLLWWDRLYRETTSNSSPDQYVDGLAIDYSNNRLLVIARTHGNNTINLWRGGEISQSLAGDGFQREFTGNNGNIHISWLGAYNLLDGRVRAATYIAEYVEGATNYGPAHPDPLLGGWPNPNGGWPNVNTTRCGADAGYSSELEILSDGSVAVLCLGRRSMTTTDAHQRMPLPNITPLPTGTWNQFVRVYRADLNGVNYSTLLTGQWDQSTGQGGDNTQLVGLAGTVDRLVVVGLQRADGSGVALGNPIGTDRVPSWGSSSPQGQSAIVAALTGTRLFVGTDILFRNSFE